MHASKGRLLIVDDDLAVRTVIARKMQSEGYECVLVGNGKEALTTATTESFDLVLLDVKMPGMSGIEVLPQIVSKCPGTGVVMVTAMADTQTAVEAMKLGAHDYITKPFNLDDLACKVQKALERRQLILENKELRLRASTPER
jgi:DNA-binding NtrC family response regulator